MSVAGATSAARLPRDVWALGVVSLFMDVSSEMIHSLLPVFLVSILGASAATVGLIEGIGEATASITRLFSGWVSDRLGRRKVLTVIGYGLAALSKPWFALAPSPAWVLAARFADRFGKGIRGAPRDALIADLVPSPRRGAAFGLRQSLDTVGAFAGPLLALALMEATRNDFRRVFLLAGIPAFVSVAVLVLAVREPGPARAAPAAAPPLRRSELGRLRKPFWLLVALAVVMTLARFSEAFLVLRARDTGLAPALVPLVLVLMNVVYAASAYPAGSLSDAVDRRWLLAAGLLALIAADALLAAAQGLPVVLLGVGIWGLHLGLTQGVLSALVVDVAPPQALGTAFGVLNFATGVALLVASVVAGSLWQSHGPAATFLAGLVFAALALAGSLAQRRYHPPAVQR
jgi:MFS family permease